MQKIILKNIQHLNGKKKFFSTLFQSEKNNKNKRIEKKFFSFNSRHSVSIWRDNFF